MCALPRTKTKIEFLAELQSGLYITVIGACLFRRPTIFNFIGNRENPPPRTASNWPSLKAWLEERDIYPFEFLGLELQSISPMTTRLLQARKDRELSSSRFSFGIESPDGTEIGCVSYEE